MKSEEYKIGDYIYYTAGNEYSVGKICRIVKSAYGNMLRCYWSENVNKLPKTFKEFDKIKKREYEGFMYDTDKIVHKLNLIDDDNKYSIEHIINDNKTIVIIHNPDGTYSKGEAKFNINDEKEGLKFNEYDGFYLAYTRALGIKAKKITELSDISNEELLDELNKRLNK